MTVPTIADVAHRAGVTKGTASRALRDLPNVSVETRRRVQDAALELRFVATPSASRLATGRTSSFGLVAPFVDRWFFSRVISGAESVLREANIDLLLYNLATDASRHQFFDRMPLRRRVDGVLILALRVAAHETAALNALDIPVVLVGAPAPDASSVGIDDFGAAVTAMNHLLNLGHRRIGFVGGDPGPLEFTTPVERLEGYRSALRRVGVMPDPALVMPGDFTVLAGQRAAAALLSLADPPTAIFAASDEMAMGVMLTAQSLGMLIPRDLSVIGIDGHDLSDAFGLTTVRQPVVEQGRAAAGLLLEAMVTAGHRRITLPVELVLRGSTTFLADAPAEVL